MFKNIKEKLCKELQEIDKQLESKDITMDDVRKLEAITHTLKSLTAWEEMGGGMEDQQGMSGSYDGGMSSRRGRGMNGRYVSREAPQPDPMGGEFGYPFPNGQQYPNSGYSGRYYPPRW